MEYKTFKGYINSLKKNQIFVFGSNPEGRHGKGTAKIAHDYYGAVYGKGRGLYGNSYALITTNLKKNFLEKNTNILYKNYGKRSIAKKQELSKAKEYFENLKKEYLVPVESAGAGLSEDDQKGYEAYKKLAEESIFIRSSI